jgi:molecular chaperone GrpE
MKEDGSGFDAPVDYGALPTDADQGDSPASGEKAVPSGSLDPAKPVDPATPSPDGAAADSSPETPSQKTDATGGPDDSLPFDPEVELVLDEVPPAEAASTPSAPETPEPMVWRRRKKGKDAASGDALRIPSQQEIFQRLMEKNELILQLSKKNLEVEARRKNLEDKRIQLLAEFENYRKRTRKEWDLLKQQTRAEVFVELLSVVDDFERAFVALGDADNEFVQGIRLIYNNMMATLARFGVTKLNGLGAKFDPNCHMAVAHRESEDVTSNHVVEVIQDGYLVDGVLLRPASVVIAK